MAGLGTPSAVFCASVDALSWQLQHGGQNMDLGDTAQGATLAVEDEASAPFFVAVHVRAGYHSPASAKLYRGAMHRACIAAAAVLTKGAGHSLDAVVAAIKVLEMTV